MTGEEVEGGGGGSKGCWMVRFEGAENVGMGAEDLVTVAEDRGFNVDLAKNIFLESFKSLSGIKTAWIPYWENCLFISDK